MDNSTNATNSGINPQMLLELSTKVLRTQALLAIDLALMQQPHLMLSLQVGSNGPRIFLGKDDIDQWLTDTIAESIETLARSGLDTTALLKPYTAAALASQSGQQNKSGVDSGQGT